MLLEIAPLNSNRIPDGTLGDEQNAKNIVS
jgi:hypothetical protein